MQFLLSWRSGLSYSVWRIVGARLRLKRQKKHGSLWSMETFPWQTCWMPEVQGFWVSCDSHISLLMKVKSKKSGLLFRRISLVSGRTGTRMYLQMSGLVCLILTICPCYPWKLHFIFEVIIDRTKKIIRYKHSSNHLVYSKWANIHSAVTRVNISQKILSNEKSTCTSPYLVNYTATIFSTIFNLFSLIQTFTKILRHTK